MINETNFLEMAKAKDARLEQIIKEAKKSSYYDKKLPGIEGYTVGRLINNLDSKTLFDAAEENSDIAEQLYREYKEIE